MFQGFTEETFDFFMGLKLNNNRTWFEEHRAEYLRYVRKPMLDLIDAVIPVAREIDPQLDLRPTRVLSRINRDTRFSKDKSPYRDYMWFVFRHTEESLSETCGIFFDISSSASHWGAGFFHAQKPMMDQLRTFCRMTPSRVLAVLEEPAFRARFTVTGEAYKRMAIPPEVPEALHEIYIKKGLYVEHTLADWQLLKKPELAQVLAKDFALLAPFYTLMSDCRVSE